MAKANFNIDASAERGFVLLEDLGTGMTITNDAEQVVAFLADAGVLADGKRVLYRDTLGVWDELLHDGTRFAGFAPLRARSREEALRVARRREREVGREL